MLTRNRPQMARRAVECFRAQTYPAKTLLIVNSGLGPMIPDGYAPDIMEPCLVGADAQTVGELRNRGARIAVQHGAEILIHWDDDDWIHTNRIAEQVALLQSSGADCVGYREMLFWRQAEREAWLYSNPNPGYALGTSLCYWRRTWERKPFPATSIGEDLQFIAGLKCAGVSAAPIKTSGVEIVVALPAMIASIHAGNSSGAYDPRKMAAEAAKPDGMWRRVPEWDTQCRSIMEGK